MLEDHPTGGPSSSLLLGGGWALEPRRRWLTIRIGAKVLARSCYGGLRPLHLPPNGQTGLKHVLSYKESSDGSLHHL